MKHQRISETLKLCLDEIRACRPFFSGLSGGRHGADLRALPRVLKNGVFEAWVEPGAGVLPQADKHRREGRYVAWGFGFREETEGARETGLFGIRIAA